MILHITPGLNKGGAEKVLYTYLDSTTFHDQCVLSLGPADDYYHKKIENLGCTIKSFNIRKRPINIIFFLVQVYKLRSTQIVGWMYYGALISFILNMLRGEIKKTTLAIHHSDPDDITLKPLTRLVARTTCYLIRYFKLKTIFCADSAVALHGQNLKESNINVINNGYSPNDIFPSVLDRVKFRNKLGVSDDEFLIIFPARFHPVKDHMTFFNAIKQLHSANNISILLAGDGCDPENVELKKVLSVANIKFRVIMLGHLDNIRVAYNSSDLTVLSSISEAFPNVIVESLLSETPCVSTDVGDVALILDEKFVFPVRDYISLSKLIHMMYKDFNSNRHGYNQLKEKCRLSIEDKFTVQKMISSYDKVIFSQ